MSDAIIGYRRPNTNQKQYLNQILTQTKQEISSRDFKEKQVAAQKLLFLFNEGTDIQWAIFNVIELMGSNSFECKRIGFVIAPLIFKEERNQEFLTLVPNIFRKDMKDMTEFYTNAISLTCLSRICNEELASLLYRELVPLYTSSKPLIRRKSCIMTYKMFYCCTDSITELISHLADRIRDNKVGV